MVLAPCEHVEYAVPQSVIDAAPAGQIYRHVAFFSRLTGRWLGEAAGYVPYPDLPLRMSAGRREPAMQRWLLHAIRGLGTRTQVIDQLWSDDFGRVPTEQQVALDVTRFAWPVGDHVWHRWVDVDRMLDWPESSGRRFIELDVREAIGESEPREGMQCPVVAQQHSHRPVRDAVPGQHVVCISGTPFESFWGHLWGRFVYRRGEWRFVPRIVTQRDGSIDELWTAPELIRRQLAWAPVDLDLWVPGVDRKFCAPLSEAPISTKVKTEKDGTA